MISGHSESSNTMSVNALDNLLVNLLFDSSHFDSQLLVICIGRSDKSREFLHMTLHWINY